MTEIIEHWLDNGLMILLNPMRVAPVATFWIWYRVGSRNEVPGITGISHWVEHMMFKGTPTLKKGQVFRSINSVGGSNNATTFTDYTTYFETLPSNKIDIALRIESDRMVNSLFDPAEVASERSVIISECEGKENQPQFLLDEEVQAAAFKVHSYHHETVGWKTDLHTMTRDDLYRHYKTYYAPNNAVIVAAGDFDVNEMMAKLEKKFGNIPRGGAIPPMRLIEPPQESERRVLLRRPSPKKYFQVDYHGPPASNPDFYPMFVLKGVLAGVHVMSSTGGGLASRSSRLYQALVAKELATDVSFSFRPSLDPGTIEVAAAARDGVPTEKVERAIFAELEKIATKPITSDELKQVILQTEAQFIYATEGVANTGHWLGLLEMVASYKMHNDFVDNIKRVSKADVQRVAAKYLAATNRTVGWLIPPSDNQPRKSKTK